MVDLVVTEDRIMSHLIQNSSHVFCRIITIDTAHLKSCITCISAQIYNLQFGNGARLKDSHIALISNLIMIKKRDKPITNILSPFLGPIFLRISVAHKKVSMLRTTASEATSQHWANQSTHRLTVTIQCCRVYGRGRHSGTHRLLMQCTLFANFMSLMACCWNARILLWLINKNMGANQTINDDSWAR